MDLLNPSVGFKQPPKLLVRHLRTQVSDKEVFHDVSPTGSFLIVGSCRAIRQEDEVERAASAPASVDLRPHPPCPTCHVYAGPWLASRCYPAQLTGSPE